MAGMTQSKEVKGQAHLTSKDYYFDSYSHFGIHEEMLKDHIRTNTYMRSIMGNPHQFRDKTVLDIGCGTGILSMFAAKAGAAAVYAVDMSSIAQQAKQIVVDNGYADVITVYHGKMEDLALPGKVDIIISEWMGYALYYESMLPTVLKARDTWLKPGGLILPDRCTVVVAGIEDEEYKQDKIDFWSNVYGFSMEPIRELARREPLVDTVHSDLITTTACTIKDIDINTMTEADIPFAAPFEIVAHRDDHLHAIVVWFDVYFGTSHKPLSFSTSPKSRATHWKQTVFYLKNRLTICTGEKLVGKLSCTPNALNPRDLDFQLEYKFDGKHSQAEESLEYRMR